MSVIDIHPEELFDRLTTGTLTESEAERLRGHLATCDVCRFELLARGDFRAELAASPERSPATPQPDAARVRATRRVLVPRRRRALIWASAAALLLMATGALASVVTGVPPWRLFAEAKNDEALPAATVRAAAARPKRGRSAPPEPLAGAGQSAEAQPAETPSSVTPAVANAASAEATPGPSAEPPAALLPVARSKASEARPESPSAGRLFADANRARARGEIARAVSLYRQLQARYPRSSEAELSELTLSTLLLHMGDARAALAGFDDYLARGTRPLQAEALVGRALARRALGQRALEIAAWKLVAERFAGTSYARRAEERLAALGGR
jgi:TolA-binding protein